MSWLTWLIAIPYFGGGLLVWPISCLFRRRLNDRCRWLRKVFFVTLIPLAVIGGILGAVAALGRFNHNWLPLTLLFPLINLASLCASFMGPFEKHEHIS
jgi:hypothetical protein